MITAVVVAYVDPVGASLGQLMPHIHATVVPIVTGERRKAKKQQVEGKRTYRKKADTVRLCADDVLTREKLVTYHDSCAKVMAKYAPRGLSPQMYGMPVILKKVSRHPDGSLNVK